MRAESLRNGCLIDEIGAHEAAGYGPLERQGFENCEPALLQLGIIIAVTHVETDDAIAAIDQTFRRVKADEAGIARDQNFHPRSLLLSPVPHTSSTSRGTLPARPKPSILAAPKLTNS